MLEEKNVSLTGLTVTYFKVLKRNFLVFALSMAIIMGLGIAYNAKLPPKYKTQFTAYSTIIKNEHAKDLFGALNIYMKEGQFEKIAELLEIDIKDAEVLRAFTAYKSDGITVKDAIPEGMTLFEVNLFTIEIHSVAPYNYMAVQEGFKNYLLKSEFVKSKIESSKKRIAREIEIIDTHISRLNTTQDEVIKQLQGRSDLKMIGTQHTSPVGIHELVELRGELTYEREMISPMMPVQNIIETNEPEGQTALVLLVFLGAGLILTNLLLFVIEVIRRV